MGNGPANTISVVGQIGEVSGSRARDALRHATVIVGSRRQLELMPADNEVERTLIELKGPLPLIFDAIAEHCDAGESVCVLASGDPGFFGIVGALGERFGSERLIVHPAPSSVSLAFALLGLPWDDATVVSAHGRPLAEAITRLSGPKIAVLTSPDNPPQIIGQAMLERQSGQRRVVVASNLGTPEVEVTHTDLIGLASGKFNPMSVVLLFDDSEGGDSRRHATLSWGLPESSFAHRDGMITKSELRAIALGKLELPSSGVLWDVGAGSGSVAVECARLCPGLQVIAVERNADDAARVSANAATHGVSVEVIHGEAPAVLKGLPDPDRVFVGGGGVDVLDAALQRLRPNGTVVATFALMERAVQAQKRLGMLVQIGVSRGVETGELGIRLSAENPVFLCWGPSPLN